MFGGELRELADELLNVLVKESRQKVLHISTILGILCSGGRT